jgi:hypothetical protein
MPEGRYLLDTDTITALPHNHPKDRRIAAIAPPGDQVL